MALDLTSIPLEDRDLQEVFSKQKAVSLPTHKTVLLSQRSGHQAKLQPCGFFFSSPNPSPKNYDVGDGALTTRLTLKTFQK